MLPGANQPGRGPASEFEYWPFGMDHWSNPACRIDCPSYPNRTDPSDTAKKTARSPRRQIAPPPAHPARSPHRPHPRPAQKAQPQQTEPEGSGMDVGESSWRRKGRVGRPRPTGMVPEGGPLPCLTDERGRSALPSKAAPGNQGGFFMNGRNAGMASVSPSNGSRAKHSRRRSVDDAP